MRPKNSRNSHLGGNKPKRMNGGIGRRQPPMVQLPMDKSRISFKERHDALLPAPRCPVVI